VGHPVDGNSGENPNRFNGKKERTTVLKAILPCVFFSKSPHQGKAVRAKGSSDTRIKSGAKNPSPEGSLAPNAY